MTISTTCKMIRIASALLAGIIFIQINTFADYNPHSFLCDSRIAANSIIKLLPSIQKTMNKNDTIAIYLYTNDYSRIVKYLQEKNGCQDSIRYIPCDLKLKSLCVEPYSKNNGTSLVPYVFLFQFVNNRKEMLPVKVFVSIPKNVFSIDILKQVTIVQGDSLLLQHVSHHSSSRNRSTDNHVEEDDSPNTAANTSGMEYDNVPQLEDISRTINNNTQTDADKSYPTTNSDLFGQASMTTQSFGPSPFSNSEETITTSGSDNVKELEDISRTINDKVSTNTNRLSSGSNNQPKTMFVHTSMDTQDPLYSAFSNSGESIATSGNNDKNLLQSSAKQTK